MNIIASGIYQIRNIKDGTLYIGSSQDIEKRFKDHKRMLKGNYHHSIKLQRAFNKSKNINHFAFEVVEDVENISLLKEREQYYIDKFDAYYSGYNCSALVDNPNYAHKRIAKKDLYDKFWMLFDKNTMTIGATFLQRIENQHYKPRTINKLINAIVWLKEHYSNEQYAFDIGVIYHSVKDINNNTFAFYIHKNNEFRLDVSTELFINDLKKRNIYDESIHYLVR